MSFHKYAVLPRSLLQFSPSSSDLWKKYLMCLESLTRYLWTYDTRRVILSIPSFATHAFLLPAMPLPCLTCSGLHCRRAELNALGAATRCTSLASFCIMDSQRPGKLPRRVCGIPAERFVFRMILPSHDRHPHRASRRSYLTWTRHPSS